MHSSAVSSVQSRDSGVPGDAGQRPRTATLKAALWDMDGTLVDTEPYWISAEFALVHAHGGTWSQEQAMGMVGQSLVHSAGVLQQAGVRMEIREIIDHLTAEVIRQVRQEIPWRPGARELLHGLFEAGVRCALVTMSEGPLAAEIVTGLPQEYFEFMVTGDAVTHGKPHPEPYLTAVQRLRVLDPQLSIHECLALEDSIPGVASAQASGVVTLAIPHSVPLPEDAGRTTWTSLAGRSVEDLRGLVGDRAVQLAAGLIPAAGVAAASAPVGTAATGSAE
ncbi:HAD family hydrolase [Arthrobacter sp. A5]|uniref:HAD family hydrolase n=1 Tax=Arthrobacter sp. A5 TaxID=576926 RepID=UPI003DA83C1F